MNGTNIIDYVDPEIEEKVRQLEYETNQLQVPEEHVLNDMEVEENEALE
jgi:hypothetical protein